MPAPLPVVTIATIKKLRAQGRSVREVAEIARVGSTTVHKHTVGIELPFGPLKRGQKKRIAFNVCKTLFDQGLTYREIGKRLGCAHSAVYRTLKTGKAAA